VPLLAPKTGRLKGGRGILLLDNRTGDVPLRLPTPDGPLLVPAGACVELPTATCGHCNATVVLHPARTRDRGFCRRCAYFVCDKPGCRRECNGLPEMLDLAVDRPTQPWLDRAPDGAPRFDTAVRDATRIR
jgi:hypothetical protein